MCWYFQYLCSLFSYMLVFFVLLKINWDGSINICLFTYRQIVSFWIYFWGFSQFIFHILNNLFSIRVVQWYLILLVLNGQPNVKFYHLYLSKNIWRNWKEFIHFGLTSWISPLMIKYAHNTYNGSTRKISSEDTLFYFQKRRRTAVSVTANVGVCWVCAHTLWFIMEWPALGMPLIMAVQGLAKSLSWELAPFDNWRLTYTITTTKSDRIGLSSI